MTDPVRLEFWGYEVVDLRHFELQSQRITREVDLAVVLPVGWSGPRDATPG
jgi:transcription-repair coupling factor (superfamily II helicase)